MVRKQTKWLEMMNSFYQILFWQKSHEKLLLNCRNGLLRRICYAHAFEGMNLIQLMMFKGLNIGHLKINSSLMRTEKTEAHVSKKSNNVMSLIDLKIVFELSLKVSLLL